jgi:hypothetical protein
MALHLSRQAAAQTDDCSSEADTIAMVDATTTVKHHP